jgi:DNA polymerase-3 subunit delta
LVQIRPADADRFVDKPDPARRLVLLYGPDDGLVSERAARLAASALGDSDPLAHVRLDGAQVADDPGLLADEVKAIPMFGGLRVVSVRASGGRSVDAALKAILDDPPADALVIVTAGDLRKSAPLRRLCETHPAAAAIACYVDGDRDLDRMIDEETATAGLTITDEARAALRALIGADRLVSRSEVVKLCLYAADAGAIDAEDVRAVIGDASALALDDTIDAALVGDTAAFDRGYRRLVASGTPGSVVAGAALRHFNYLETARAAYDGGAEPDSLVASARPPVFYQRRRSVARQISLWSAANIERALARLDRAMIDSRLNRGIENEVVGQALCIVAASAAANARRAGGD